MKSFTFCFFCCQENALDFKILLLISLANVNGCIEFQNSLRNVKVLFGEFVPILCQDLSKWISRIDLEVSYRISLKILLVFNPSDLLFGN